MERQHRLLERMATRGRRQQKQPLLWAVVDEATLTNHTVGAAVMREQIDFLISMAEHGQASLQVLPVNKSAIAAAADSFSTLRLGIQNLEDVIYLEQLNSALFLDDRRECDPYKQAWNRLTIAAEPPSETVKLLLRARDDL